MRVYDHSDAKARTGLYIKILRSEYILNPKEYYLDRLLEHIPKELTFKSYQL